MIAYELMRKGNWKLSVMEKARLEVNLTQCILTV
ncbi:hypothetical protein HEP75_00628 [Xanthomonas sp. SI]|nr:hypothetical protein HEP75_00628 [Xanthomonas sp. SI]